jgi:hypothetical protein
MPADRADLFIQTRASILRFGRNAMRFTTGATGTPPIATVHAGQETTAASC